MPRVVVVVGVVGFMLVFLSPFSAENRINYFLTIYSSQL